jgi:hypothetical protein
LRAAGEKLSQARSLLDDLVALDPANLSWAIAGLRGRLNEAILARRNGDLLLAGKLAEEIQPRLENLAAREPTNRAFALWLVRILTFEAQLHTTTDPSLSANAVNRAAEIGEKCIQLSRATNTDVGQTAQACVLAGELAVQSGGSVVARQHWLRAAEILRPRLPGSRDWRLLDPAARVAAAQGRTEEARLIVEKLQKFGYVPIDPWPPAIASGAAGPVP